MNLSRSAAGTWTVIVEYLLSPLTWESSDAIRPCSWATMAWTSCEARMTSSTRIVTYAVRMIDRSVTAIDPVLTSSRATGAPAEASCSMTLGGGNEMSSDVVPEHAVSRAVAATSVAAIDTEAILARMAPPQDSASVQLTRGVRRSFP